MKLLVVEKDNREVLAILEDGEPTTCPVIEFLMSQPKDMAKSAKGFKALFERYAAHGRQGLTTHLFHEVDKNEKILEFIKGRLRIFCFEDAGGIVILSHGAVKKGQKVDRAEVSKAIRNKALYLEAKSSGQLIRVSDGEKNE
ncbi:Phage derived protein Gp49-like (DUF891) [Mariprofundus aestuarium]|uniref:Phage derived protein Gp49-like (DUF891) n=1 Tax=Mariprofundus aestuarium TaxID=1921086 RepID=A0A2K8L032_MARES|nr:type II toxin-antitoxin system RelE/ParE family toxin [Mariprofundus aestuarium]ATX80650.1 Phage derived protein Gp49-like (DUF891) [Mariprofundus aestuarium]